MFSDTDAAQSWQSLTFVFYLGLTLLIRLLFCCLNFIVLTRSVYWLNVVHRYSKVSCWVSTDNNHHFGGHVLLCWTLCKTDSTLSGSYTQGKVSNFKFMSQDKLGGDLGMGILMRPARMTYLAAPFQQKA